MRKQAVLPRLLGLAVAMLLLPSTAGADETETVETVQDPESAIRQARAASNQGLREHNVDAVMAVLEDEAQFTVSSGAVFYGRDRQKQVYESVFTQFPNVVYERKPSTVQVAEDGVFAAENGRWTGSWSTDDGPVEQHGTYMAMWRHSQGGWLIRSEIYVKLECKGEGCPPLPQASDD